MQEEERLLPSATNDVSANAIWGADCWLPTCLCCFLDLRDSFRCRLRGLPRFLFRGKLMLDPECNRIGLHLISLGCCAENPTSIILRSCRKQDDGFDDQLADKAFLGLAEKGGQQLGCGFTFLRPDTSVPGDDLHTLLVEQGKHLFSDEEQVALHQTNGDGGDDGLQNTHDGERFTCIFERDCLATLAPHVFRMTARKMPWHLCQTYS